MLVKMNKIMKNRAFGPFFFCVDLIVHKVITVHKKVTMIQKACYHDTIQQGSEKAKSDIKLHTTSKKYVKILSEIKMNFPRRKE